METTQNGRMCRLIDVNCDEKWVRPLHHLFNSFEARDGILELVERTVSSFCQTF